MEHRGRFAYSVEKGCIGMTNAQKIRAMSDEELARFFIGDSPNYCHPGLCLDGETCIGCFLTWLQQPAGEEGKHEAD